MYNFRSPASKAAIAGVENVTQGAGQAVVMYTLVVYPHGDGASFQKRSIPCLTGVHAFEIFMCKLCFADIGNNYSNNQIEQQDTARSCSKAPNSSSME